jgi:hypothetical protein
MGKIGLGRARRVDNDRDDHGLTSVCLSNPGAHGLAYYLLKLMAISHSIARGLSQCLLDCGQDVIKNMVFFCICSCLDGRALD